MIIDCEQMDEEGKDIILNHMLLAGNRELIDKVLATLPKKADAKDRIIDVKVLFNNIEYDGQVLEDVLQEQWKYRCDKLEKKYSDLEDLAEKKAQELFNKFTSDLIHPIYKKLDDIRERVENVHLELNCFNPQLKDWSIDE